MNALPLEIIIEIAKCDVPTYRGLVLAYPRFAQWVTRVTIFEPMVWFGYNVSAGRALDSGCVWQSGFTWRCNGIIHAVAWPAVTAKGINVWYRNGKRHRTGGPAIVYGNGAEHWCKDGKLHRDDGPAITHVSGYCAWYRDGVRHRDCGPALIHVDGSTEHWTNGIPCLPLGRTNQSLG